MMPKMNGFDFLEQVRKENRWMNTPVIFLTAKGTTPDKHRGKQLGVDDYLTKPFDAKDLIVAIDAKIDLSKKRRDASNEVLERKKNEMIQVLNHEFRTPLTLIIGYSDMLKGVDGAPGGGPDLNMFLNEITSGAERIRRLIENFILLVELDSGDAGVHPISDGQVAVGGTFAEGRRVRAVPAPMCPNWVHQSPGQPGHDQQAKPGGG
jgi:response regulator RpfG family c-di-GMP phosphodiesterase